MDMPESPKALDHHFEMLSTFIRGDLRRTIADIETAVLGQNIATLSQFLEKQRVSRSMLESAAEVKRVAGQIDVTIHALGILKSLPHIMRPGEEVLSVSLGAGNTGRSFDLETNFRVAEFKFIAWKGHDTVRQNGTFKDFFDLVSAETSKEKFLYLRKPELALRFFQGRRALASVLSKATHDKFFNIHGERYTRVREFYQDHKHLVQIVDASPWLPELSALPTAETLTA